MRLLVTFFLFSNAILVAQEPLDGRDSLSLIHAWRNASFEILKGNRNAFSTIAEPEIECAPCLYNDIDGYRLRFPNNTVPIDTFMTLFYDKVFNELMLKVIRTHQPIAARYDEDAFCVYYEMSMYNAIFIMRRRETGFLISGYTTIP